MINRDPKYPGRVLITPEDGTAAHYATITRADEPRHAGTPINKGTLLSDSTAKAVVRLTDSVTVTPDDALANLTEFLSGNMVYSKSGTYTGTGSGTVKLEFDFTPSLVVVQKNGIGTNFGGGNESLGFVAQNGMETVNIPYATPSAAYASIALTWGEKSLEWSVVYSSSYDQYAMGLNESGVEYHYIAFGASDGSGAKGKAADIDIRDFITSDLRFFGDFYEGLAIMGAGNASNPLNLSIRSYGVTALTDCSGGGSYCIYQPQDMGKEDGSYYFKIAYSAADIKTIKAAVADKDVSALNPLSTVAVYTSKFNAGGIFTIPTEANTLLVQVGKYNVPEFLHIEKDGTPGTYTSYQNSYRLKTAAIEDAMEKVKIEKTSDTVYRITLGKYYTNLMHTTNESINVDTWNIRGVYYQDGTTIVTSGTDILGPLKEKGQSDFMGGVHGDEINTALAIFCDGIAWDRISTVSCSEIKAIMASKLYRVDSKEHVYNRFVTITITPGKIRVENLFHCVVDDSVVSRATNGGLIALPNSLITAVSTNNCYIQGAPTESPGNESRSNITATIFWEHGSVTVDNLVGHERDTYLGYIAYMAETNPRTKIYFDLIAGSGKAITKGEEIGGVFEYRFV